MLFLSHNAKTCKTSPAILSERWFVGDFYGKRRIMDTWDSIIDWNNVLSSYYKTQVGKPKHKECAVEFKKDETQNLTSLLEDVTTGRYTPSQYNKFKVYEPKERVIFAPSYRDKIVHHMVYGVLRDLYEPSFIYHSYSCIRGKGNKAATLAIQKMLKTGSKWIVKLDVSKFFPSIDRDILKSLLRIKLSSTRTLGLCDTIINSSPTKTGLPLGCVTSQLFANIYLNEVDKFIKHQLKVRFYVRYADDLFLFLRHKGHAKYVKEQVRDYLQGKLNLACPENKSYIAHTSRGVDGLGYKIFWDHIQIKSKAKKRFENSILSKRNEQSVNSWLGYAKVANSDTYIYKVCHRYSMHCNGYKISSEEQ